jgi:hypothetical protein
LAKFSIHGGFPEEWVAAGLKYDCFCCCR